MQCRCKTQFIGDRGNFATRGAVECMYPPTSHCPISRPDVGGLYDDGQCCGQKGLSSNIPCIYGREYLSDTLRMEIPWSCKQSYQEERVSGGHQLLSSCFSIELTVTSLACSLLGYERRQGPLQSSRLSLLRDIDDLEMQHLTIRIPK